MELTISNARASIDIPLPHEAVEFDTSKITGQKRPLSSVVFLYPSKIINTGLFRVKHFLADCVGHLSRWSVPVADSVNSAQSATQRLTPKSGGYIPNTGETAMPNHPPKSKNTQTHYVSLESLFLLLDSNKNQITSDLTFKQAQEITNHIPGSVVKFQKMTSRENLEAKKIRKRQDNPLSIADHSNVASRICENYFTRHESKDTVTEFQMSKINGELKMTKIALSELIEFDTDELKLLGKTGRALVSEIKDGIKILIESEQRLVSVVSYLTHGSSTNGYKKSPE